MRIETLAVRAGHAVDPSTGAVTPPIHLSTTFERERDGTFRQGHVYARTSNPGRQSLESALAQLEGGTSAIAFSSGLAATSAVFQALGPGDHVLVPEDAYYGTLRLVREIFGPWGLESDACDMSDLAAVERLIRPTTRVLWVETPSNPLPFSRGNSPERTESAPEERARGAETEIPPNTEPPKPQPQEQLARFLPPANTGSRRETDTSRPAPGRLGDALRNLDRYVQSQTFNTPQGGANDPGSSIQFDTRGIDFGPWLRRFVAQVRRNWFFPLAAANFHGRVAIQFKVHKDGSITDVNVVSASGIDAFNRAAFNAIVGSNPTEPLPPEYPLPVIDPFTVTFYYNEQPF
jgi:TonB family protein